jgi:hypothetical protein
MWDTRKAYKILTGKRPLGGPGRIWPDIIKMVLREVSCEDEIWTLAQVCVQWGVLV